HPRTGDLYVAIGGRGTRGAVYRIRYTAGMKEAEDFVMRPMPSKSLPARIDHADPLGQVPSRQTNGAANGRRGPLYVMRRWQRDLGGLGARDASGTVFEGYSLRSSQEIPTELQESVRAEFRSRFDKGNRAMDYESARALALVEDGNAEAFARV